MHSAWYLSNVINHTMDGKHLLDQQARDTFEASLSMEISNFDRTSTARSSGSMPEVCVDRPTGRWYLVFKRL